MRFCRFPVGSRRLHGSVEFAVVGLARFGIAKYLVRIADFIHTFRQFRFFYQALFGEQGHCLFESLIDLFACGVTGNAQNCLG